MNKGAKVFNSKIIFLSVFSILITFYGCNDIEEITEPAKIFVSLVDSPADYEALNINIQEVSLKTNGTQENNGWISLAGFEPGVYNILDYTGGRELILADMDFPAGEISQLKIKLGQNNTLVMRGYTSQLLNANSAESGQLLNVSIDVNPGKTHYIKLDFDASRSVTGLGMTGQKILKPVLRLFSETNTGSLTGKVLPEKVNVLINILENNRIIASSYATKDVSTFLIPGIEEGSYRVSMEIGDNDEQKFFDRIDIIKGKVTDMGTIFLDD